MHLLIRNSLYLIVVLLFPMLGYSQIPEHIFYNAKILTVDANFTVAEAIAIDGERILAVGTNDQIRELAATTTVQTDLEGKTVIPGLIDNHIHYLRGTNFAAYETRIHGVTSRQEVLSLSLIHI